MRRVACALSAPTACYGFCCRDSGRVGADVCRWCNPPRSSLGTGELSPCIGHGSHVPAGKTENDCGDSRLDSAHEPRQPVVGSPPRSRGTPKVGNRGGAIDGGQVSATAPEAAHADLANIPDQSLAKDAPEPRAVEKADQGHHRYQRRAAYGDRRSDCCAAIPGKIRTSNDWWAPSGESDPRGTLREFAALSTP